MQVCILEEGDTWMTPYRRYIADGILPAEGRQEGEDKLCKVYSGGWSAFQAWIHTPNLDVREWGRVHKDNVGAP